MATNGSTIIPSFRYHDAPAAIAWLERVLGFARQAVYESASGTIDHAQLTLGSGMIMLGSASNANPHPDIILPPKELGGRVSSPIYVVVTDCKPVFARAQAEGAEIMSELKTMDYGGAAFTVRDPEGYIWSIGEYDPWVTDASKEA